MAFGTTRRRRSDLRSLPFAQASRRAGARCIHTARAAAPRDRIAGQGRQSRTPTLHPTASAPQRAQAQREACAPGSGRTGQGPGASGRAKNHTKRDPFLARPASEACADPWEKHWVRICRPSVPRALASPAAARRAGRSVQHQFHPLKQMWLMLSHWQSARRAGMLAACLVQSSCSKGGSSPRSTAWARSTCTRCAASTSTLHEASSSCCSARRAAASRRCSTSSAGSTCRPRAACATATTT